MPYELVGEVLGYDDIIGVEAEVSAMRRISPGPGYPGGAQLRTRGPSKAREWVMGIDSIATIGAAVTSTLTTRPQVTFRVDRLVIPGSIAASFLLNDFKVGMSSQFVAGVAVPAEVFGHAAVGVRLKGDTAQISQDVILSVTNTSAGALRFNAAIIGPAVV